MNWLSVLDIASSISSSLLAEEHTSRHGEAIAEYIKGYKGYTGANGEHVKGLKDIANMNITDHRNIQQQAGLSAEVFSEAKTNADHILSGSEYRVRRTDGIGFVNHSSIDHVATDTKGIPLIDQDGKWIDTSQMKFRSSAKSNVQKLLSDKEFEKYRHVYQIKVPSDQFNETIDIITNRKAELTEQIATLKQLDKPNELADKRKQLEKCESVEKRLRDSGISKDEAERLRMKPLKESLKEVNKVSHEAAIKQGRDQAIISGLTSLIQQVILLSKQDKPDYVAAAKAVIKELSFAFGTAYSVTYISSILKGWLAASEKHYIKSVSKSNMITSTIAELSSLIIHYIRTPDYTMRDFFFDLSDKTVAGLIGSFASGAGTFVLAAFVGPIIASSIGFLIGSTVYNCVKSIMREANDSTKQLEQLEQRAEQVKSDLISKQKVLKQLCEEFLTDKTSRLNEYIDLISTTLDDPDHNRFVEGWEKFAEQFNIELQYVKPKEFDQFMKDSSTTFIL